MRWWVLGEVVNMPVDTFCFTDPESLAITSIGTPSRVLNQENDHEGNPTHQGGRRQSKHTSYLLGRVEPDLADGQNMN